MDQDDLAAFDAAHARLADLDEHPTVLDLARRYHAGEITFMVFLASLSDVPEVAAALKAIGSGVAGAAGGPFAWLTGPAGSALVSLGLNAVGTWAAKAKAAALAAKS